MAQSYMPDSCAVDNGTTSDRVDARDMLALFGDAPSPPDQRKQCFGQGSENWATLLTPCLRALLVANNYSNEQAHIHCEFFETHVVPWLGPSPTRLSSDGSLRHRGPVPRLTKDGTPLEFSLTWKGSDVNRTPGTRYVVEIASQEPRPLRSTNLIRALEALQALSAVAESPNAPLQVVIFDDVWKAVTLRMLEFDRLKHNGQHCSRCGESAMYLGFDLAPSKVKLKPYWHLPVCATSTELLDLVDSIILACQPLDAFYSSAKLLREWHTVRAQTAAARHGSVCHPLMLSMDATKAPEQRFKFYTRCIFEDSIDFERWSQHMNVHGQDSVDENFKHILGDLWKDLCRPEFSWTAEQQQKRPNFVGIQYDLQSNAELRSRIYIMCPEIARPDNYIAQKLLKHFTILQKARLIQAMAATSEPTDFATVIAARPCGVGLEFTLYFTPALFAQSEWQHRYSSNGFFRKVRNSSYHPPEELSTPRGAERSDCVLVEGPDHAVRRMPILEV